MQDVEPERDRAQLNLVSVVHSGLGYAHANMTTPTLDVLTKAALNPVKSRVLLQLALTKTRDPVQIQKMFYEY